MSLLEKAECNSVTWVQVNALYKYALDTDQGRG